MDAFSRSDWRSKNGTWKLSEMSRQSPSDSPDDGFGHPKADQSGCDSEAVFGRPKNQLRTRAATAIDIA